MNEIHTWIVERLPLDQDLDRLQLTELATALGRQRRLWNELAHHDADERFFLQLYRGMHVDVWLICWLNTQDTGYHDHDLSSGAVYVCEGVLAEDRLHFAADGIQELSRERPAGAAFDFDAAYIHRLRHSGGPPVTSVHCYSPPLWRMGYYEPDAHGDLCRTSVTYLDEVGEGSHPELRR